MSSTGRELKVKWSEYDENDANNVKTAKAFQSLIADYFDIFKCLPDNSITLDIGDTYCAYVDDIVFGNKEIVISIKFRMI